MKVICEYCGTQIDINKNSLCPSCGASFENNLSYKRIKEHKKKHEEIDLQEREVNLENKRLFHQSINNVTGVFKNVSGIFKIVVPIIFLIIILVFVFVFYAVSKSFSRNDIGSSISSDNGISDVLDNIINKEDGEQINDKEVIVGLNEFGEISKYRVKVDSYEVIKKYPFAILDGYQIVTFHFIVENLTGEKYWLSDSINCIVDGIAQNSKHDFDRDGLPASIAKDLTVHGYEAFEVPKNAKSYDIKFGDYITIHIEL